MAVPEVGPTDVLVEIGQCGICGTDVHLVLERIARPGTVLGHEWAGTIAAVGDDVEGWSIGDRVVCGPSPGCGECRACRAGRPSVCLDRPLADHLDFRVRTRATSSHRPRSSCAVPESLSIRDAALTEPTAVALHAVTLSGATPTTACWSPARVRWVCSSPRCCTRRGSSTSPCRSRRRCGVNTR